MKEVGGAIFPLEINVPHSIFVLHIPNMVYFVETKPSHSFLVVLVRVELVRLFSLLPRVLPKKCRCTISYFTETVVMK